MQALQNYIVCRNFVACIDLPKIQSWIPPNNVRCFQIRVDSQLNRGVITNNKFPLKLILIVNEKIGTTISWIAYFTGPEVWKTSNALPLSFPNMFQMVNLLSSWETYTRDFPSSWKNSIWLIRLGAHTNAKNFWIFHLLLVFNCLYSFQWNINVSRFNHISKNQLEYTNISNTS